MPFCKKCEAWIPTEDAQCEECGAIKGVYAFMNPEHKPEEKVLKTAEIKSEDTFKAPAEKSVNISDDTNLKDNKIKDKKVLKEEIVKEPTKVVSDLSSNTIDIIDSLDDSLDDIEDFDEVKQKSSDMEINNEVSEKDNSDISIIIDDIPEIEQQEQFDLLEDENTQIIENPIIKPEIKEKIIPDTDITNIDLSEYLSGLNSVYGEVDNFEEQSSPLADLDCEDTDVSDYIEELNSSEKSDVIDEAGLLEDTDLSTENKESITEMPDDTNNSTMQNAPEGTKEEDVFHEIHVNTTPDGAVSTKTKKKKKLPIILVIIVAILIVLFVMASKFGVLDLLKHDEIKSTTATTAVSTTLNQDMNNTITNITQPEENYVDVKFVDESEMKTSLDGIINSNLCGIVLSADLSDKTEIVLKTDKDYEISFKVNPNITYEASNFTGHSVAVVGEMLYNDITATEVYIYDPEAITTQPTEITQYIAPDKTDDNITEPSTSKTVVSKTTALKITTTTQSTYADIQFISESEAESLKQKWSSDRTQLGSSNAYFGTISKVIFSEQTICLITSSKSIYFDTENTFEESELKGKNVLAVAKTQNGKIIASQIYIY